MVSVTSHGGQILPVSETGGTFRFPWGLSTISLIPGEIPPRESAYLRWVFSQDQPKRGELVLKLLDLKRYLPRSSLIRILGPMRRYTRMLPGVSTKRTERLLTGEPYTTPTSFLTRRRQRRSLWDYSTR